MEKFYNKEGQIKSEEVAEELAYIEKPFREEKKFGIFPVSKKQIEEGKSIVLEEEKKYKDLLEELKDTTLKLEKDHSYKYTINSFHLKGTVKGHQLDYQVIINMDKDNDGEYTFNLGSHFGSVDKNYLSDKNADKIFDKYKPVFEIKLNEMIQEENEEKSETNELRKKNEKDEDQLVNDFLS